MDDKSPEEGGEEFDRERVMETEDVHVWTVGGGKSSDQREHETENEGGAGEQQKS